MERGMVRSMWNGVMLAGLAALALAALSGCGRQAEPTVESFLERHWAEPLPPQGAPPKTFSPLEASLQPESCAQCHAEQYAGWKTSLHSRTMGPGLRWQLMLMDQDQGNRCLRCHAPLAEQKALVALELGWPNAPKQPPPEYVGAHLDHRGLVCAACHVRGHERFGPPPRGGQAEGVPHGGFTVSRAFEDSRFCAHCHQFPDDGPRVGGKLQEDTYQQWLASPYAGEGPGRKTCQQCHMPERQHLWRGIHDPDMTRKAVEVTLALEPVAGGYEALARVRNQGAGHHFPTYMVPKVELAFYRHDADGKTQELGRHVIGWQVDTAITREIADTRIPAGETREFRQRVVAPAGDGWRVELVMRVLPGEHYERIYRESLSRAGQFPPAAVPVLRQALAQVEAAHYELLRLDAAPAP
jgi:hypothetical protein